MTSDVEDRGADGRTGFFAFLSRRRFLKRGLFFAGAALGAAGGGLVALRGREPRIPDLRLLDGHAYRTLESLMEVMFPPTASMPVDVAAMDLPRVFDAFLADEPPQNIEDLEAALLLLELGPLVFDGRFTTFSGLDVAEREGHLRAWAESDTLLRRQVSLGMRKFFHLVFFDRPEVWPHIGYPGPSLAGGAGGSP